MVAVWMVTYNHDEFIEEAIESVMMQECTFKYKLFIGEDNSIDKTREICEKLKKKYPDKINLFLHNKNIGSKANGMYMYDKCFESKAEYIAIIDGDDYWIDPYKLQKQVEKLESNHDFVLCCSNAKILRNNILNNTNEINNYLEDKVLNTKNIISDFIFNPIPTASILFRSSILKKIDFDFIANCKIGDWPLLFELSRYGKFYFYADFFSVYRISEKGIWSGLESRTQFQIKMEFYFLIKTNYPEYTALCEEQILKVIDEFSDYTSNEWCVFYSKKIEEQYKLLNSRDYIINNYSFSEFIKLLIHKISAKIWI